jgi:hypothetical protein
MPSLKLRGECQPSTGLASAANSDITAPVSAFRRYVCVNGLDINREPKIVYRKDKHPDRAAQTFIEMAQQ